MQMFIQIFLSFFLSFLFAVSVSVFVCFSFLSLIFIPVSFFLYIPVLSVSLSLSSSLLQKERNRKMAQRVLKINYYSVCLNKGAGSIKLNDEFNPICANSPPPPSSISPLPLPFYISPISVKPLIEADLELEPV